MTTDFMGELQDGIVGKGIFELKYLFYSVGDDKNVVNVPAVQMGFRGGNVVEYGIFDVGQYGLLSRCHFCKFLHDPH